MGEWQPIETAPKGERDLLLCCGGRVYQGFWGGKNWYAYYDLDMIARPTHWMPLPEPPWLTHTSSRDVLPVNREHQMTEWQPMETAPKGGGAELVTDPNWVQPPRILLRFGDEAVSVAYWDWYYAEGGNGYTDGFAWIEPCSGEQLNLHYSTPPDGWMPLPRF